MKRIMLLLVVLLIAACHFDKPLTPTLQDVAAPYVAEYGNPQNTVWQSFPSGGALAIYEWYVLTPHWDIDDPTKVAYYTFEQYHDARFATDNRDVGWYFVAETWH